MNESCHTYEWVMSHVWMSHVTRMNESCHTYECVKCASHTRVGYTYATMVGHTPTHTPRALSLTHTHGGHQLPPSVISWGGFFKQVNLLIEDPSPDEYHYSNKERNVWMAFEWACGGGELPKYTRKYWIQLTAIKVHHFAVRACFWATDMRRSLVVAIDCYK